MKIIAQLIFPILIYKNQKVNHLESFLFSVLLVPVSRTSLAWVYYGYNFFRELSIDFMKLKYDPFFFSSFFFVAKMVFLF